MLPPRLDATGVKPAGAITPPASSLPVNDARQAALQRVLGGLVGLSMQGQVLSNYQDGSSLVRVAGASMRMMLPPGAQVGAEVPMTLIAVTPRPTFQIGNQAAQGQTAPMYTEAGLAQGDAAEQLPSQGALPGRPGAGQAGPGASGFTAPPAAAAADGAEAQAGAGKAGAQAGSQQAGPQGAANGANGAAGGAANPALASAANAAASAAANAAAGAAAKAAANTAAKAEANTAANANAASKNAGTDGAARPGQGTQAGAAQANGAGGTIQARPQSLAAALLGRAPLTPSDQLPQLDHNTPTPTLSQGARAIASALASAYHAPGVPATITGKTPLVTAGAPEPQQLAKNLRDALGSSGLFYESHVADWAEGKRSLSDLQREPQMQRGMAQQGPQTGDTLAKAALAGPDLSAAQMINQQLHAHEQQRVQWNGEVWPGQPMQWEVRREQRDDGRPDQQDAHDGEQEQIWRSGVRFRFPLLGQVSASVTLVGEQVHIQVQTGDGDSAATLRAWSGELQRALEAAGSPLASLTIAAGEDGDGQ
ncbi:flagellar hook-length control protein FliK [Pseudoduganella namucuonensis]|uniref:Hook-length control protein FliK n=1 Tax=Pseudoduganella namucuonensis TaxID=1035707 RepID=A0A1I7KZZ8_9BURK|nr:flagellar hook-length control protein FliK [Pseudoduganella namucuonensis]SFV02884.1 hook-length control protein FliK [Pseudoduganella namucuonensis]